MLFRLIGKIIPFYRQLNVTWYSVFKPIYYLTSLFGIFPYSIRHDSKNIFKTHRNSYYINFIYAFIIFIILCVFCVLHIQDVAYAGKSYNMTNENLTGMNYLFEFVFLIFYCSVAYYCAFTNGKLYVNILNRMIATCRRIAVDRHEKNMKLVDKRIKNIIYSYTLSVVVTIIINFTRKGPVWKSVLVLFTFILPQAVQLATLAHYCSLIVMISGLLDNIILCLSYYDQNKRVANGIWTIKPRTVTTLSNLKICYIKVYNIKEDINKAFQAPLLLTAIQCFHCLVSEAFIVYHGVAAKLFSVHEFINCSTWIVCQLYKIYILCYSGNLLKIKVVKIGKALCNIEIENNGLQQYMEIQHFSTLISYHNLKLSVYGYFFLDATLMYNMISSITMYFIILVQFDRN